MFDHAPRNRVTDEVTTGCPCGCWFTRWWKLPDRQRTCVTLHYLLGAPVKAVASLIGLSCSTVRSHLAVAMNQLAIELTERDGVPSG
ncbi:sigma-70 region 4 domain-containing protein [Streptomyces sp. NPDC005283]|uniref:sigma-70 region 4 domain-containing protein n=1 Tax=Streptomyces sp. NPDC005283 TaxID=3156871 RepID=UPI003454E653